MIAPAESATTVRPRSTDGAGPPRLAAAPARPNEDLLVPVRPLLVVGAVVAATMLWVALTSGRYSDFEMFYDSALAVREGRDLYFSAVTEPGWRNMNPPHFVLLMAPLAWLPIREALLLWWGVTAAAMAGCVVLWRRVLPPAWALAVFALLLVSPAGYLNLRAGNQSWITALAVTWAWVAWRSGARRRGAAIFGVVASIKLFVLIALPYFVWRRQWRAAAAFVGGVAAAVAVGLAAAGPAAYGSWLLALQEQTWQGQPLSMSILGGVTRALDSAPHLAPIVVRPDLILPLWLLASAIVAFALWWWLRTGEDVDRDFAALLTAMLLVTPAGWVYYIPIAAGPVAAAAANGRVPWLWTAGTLLLLLPYPFAAGASSSSVAATLSVASSYLWGGLALLVATLLAPRSCQAVRAD